MVKKKGKKNVYPGTTPKVLRLLNRIRDQELHGQVTGFVERRDFEKPM